VTRKQWNLQTRVETSGEVTKPKLKYLSTGSKLIYMHEISRICIL